MALFGKSTQKSAPAPAQGISLLAQQDKKITEVGLKTGTRLTIQVPSSAGSDDEITVFSTYEISIGTDAFLITAPMHGSELYPLHKGERIKIAYVTENAFFETEALVAERLKKGDLNYLKMQCVSPVKRNQRRNDFRLDILLDVTVLRCNPENFMIPLSGAEPQKCLVNNLSAGGAAMYTPEEMDIGGIILAKLPPEVYGSPKELVSQVHWVRSNDNKNVPYKYYVGIRFLFENSKDKEALVKFTLDQQRKQMRKENRND